MGYFSIWSIILYVLIPLGLVLLILLTFPPIDYRSEINNNPPHSLHRRWGKLRRYTNKFVETVLFTRLGILPTDLINFLLFGLSIMFAVLCARVYTDQHSIQGRVEKMLDVQLLQQGQSWRRQRNLYLTGLALVIWYFVMICHSLQTVLLARNEQIDKLYKQLQDNQRGDISSISGGNAAATQQQQRRQPLEVLDERKQD